MKFPRLGLIVPKRLLSRAVDRNRVRRLLREWFRNNQGRLDGRDLVVRLSARPTDPRSLLAEVTRLCAEE
jgi:ribonuclease P protein component